MKTVTIFKILIFKLIHKISLKIRRCYKDCLLSKVEYFITTKIVSNKSIYEDIMPYKNEVNIESRVAEIIKNFYKHPKQNHLIIIDDSYGIVDVVKEYVNKAMNKNELINTDILSFGGMHAPFVLMESLKQLNIRIDYAIIDIVLPGKMMINGINTKYDGIDVAIYLNKFYGCKNFCFYSGNIVSEYVDYINDKMEKFEAHFGKNLKDFIIYKGNLNESQTIEEFTQLFKKEKYCINSGYISVD